MTSLRELFSPDKCNGGQVSHKKQLISMISHGIPVSKMRTGKKRGILKNPKGTKSGFIQAPAFI